MQLRHVGCVHKLDLVDPGYQLFVNYQKSIYPFLVCVYERLVIDPVINQTILFAIRIVWLEWQLPVNQNHFFSYKLFSCCNIFFIMIFYIWPHKCCHISIVRGFPLQRATRWSAIGQSDTCHVIIIGSFMGAIPCVTTKLKVWF